MDVLKRVKLRAETDAIPDAQLADMVQSVKDRITLRAGVADFPAALSSVAVEASLKAVRRWFYEGLRVEGDGANRVEFFEDALAEFADEIEAYRRQLQKAADEEAGRKRGVVRFL